MITPDQYIAAVGHRLTFARGQVQQTQVGPLQATVGHVYDSLGLTNMHICVVAAVVDQVTGFVVQDFSQHVAAFATATTGGVRGFGSAALGIAGLVCRQVDGSGQQAATSAPSAQWAAETRPVVVDVTTGAVHTFTGTKVIGFALQSYFKDQVKRYFPTPAEVAAELQQPPPPHQRPPGPVRPYQQPRQGPPPR